MKSNIVILITSFFIFLSCSKYGENNITKWTDVSAKSQEIYELEMIRDFVYNRISDYNISRKDFLKAILLNDVSNTANLLRCSIAEIEDLNNKLSETVNVLKDDCYSRFNIKSNNNLEFFIGNYDNIQPKLKQFSGVINKSQQRVGCKYGQYTTCLMLAGYGAAATGGAALLVYAGGSYLCLCSYCSGGWVNWACF